MASSPNLRRFGPTRLTSIGAWDRVVQRKLPMVLARSVENNAPDALAFVHQVEPLVDVRQWHGVGDHRIDLDLSLHVPVDDSRHVGAAARPAESRSLPDPAGDKLERPGRNFCAGRRNANDNGLAPAAMACLQRLAHYRDIARAIEGVVGAADLVCAALCHVDEVRDQIAADIFRIDEMGHPEALAPLLLGVVDVDADDHVGAGKPQSLDDIEPMPPSPNTTHLEPGSTLAVLRTAPMPVVTPQPM